MISVVQGRPGTGKTVFLVSEIIRMASRGLDVYTNVEVKFPLADRRNKFIHRIESLEDILHLREGEIVLDEVQTYLNSRNWDKLDIRFQLLLQQHRKRGLNILGATQSVTRVDVVFRQLVQRFYDVRRVFIVKLFGKPFGLFVLREYDPDSIESGTGNYVPVSWPYPVAVDPFTFLVYDTTQEYSIPSKIGTKVTEHYVITQKTVESKELLSRELLAS